MDSNMRIEQEPLKKPMDRALMGNDLAALRQVCGMLNNPAITGAVVPPEEKTSAITAPTPVIEAQRKQEDKRAAAALQANSLGGDMPLMPLTPHQKKEAKPVMPRVTQTQTTPVQVTSHDAVNKLFFTGHPFAGKSWLADQLHARVFEFADPIYAIAANAFGSIEDVSLLAPFVNEIYAWGEGLISNDYPLSPVRAMFCDWIKESGEEGDALMGVPVSQFGTSGYWAACLLSRVERFLRVPEAITTTRVVVTGVNTPEQYKFLRDSGFRPYHVACHNTTRASRGATTESFNRVAAMVEQDITAKLSREKTGSKFWCIWNDTQQPMPSQRLLSLQEFLTAYK